MLLIGDNLRACALTVLEKFDLVGHRQVQLLDLFARRTELCRRRAGELADVVDQMRLVEVAACSGKAAPVRCVDAACELAHSLEPKHPTQPLRSHTDMGREHLDEPAAA